MLANYIRLLSLGESFHTQKANTKPKKASALAEVISAALFSLEKICLETHLHQALV